MEFRDLKKQYAVLQKDMDQAILQAVASGAYIMGPQVKELEAQLAEYVGVKHCLTCANGTDALTLALKAWGIGPGDAVFVPDFTFFSSAEVVALEGATPVFVDVCEDTFNLDASDLERAVEAAGKSEGGEAGPALAEGVKMTLNTLFESLKRFGFEEVPALGEDFDPEKHNAVMREATDDPGKVLEVFQKGYRVKDKIIRYAMVKVSVEE